MDGPLTERSFLEYLHELDHKINFLYEKPPNDIKCFNDVHEILYKLKIKVSRVSHHLNQTKQLG